MSVRPGYVADRPDALSVALDALRATEGRFYSSRLPAGWGLRFAATGGCAFHVLRRGSGRIWVAGEERMLRRGELLLLPHGDAHAVGERPDGVEVGFPAAAATHRDWTRGGPLAAELVCGELRLREETSLPLLAALPRVLTVAGEPVEGVLAALEAAADDDAPGAAAVVCRLAEVLALHAIRAWASSGADVPAWVAGARDPRIGRALSALHADPGAPWSVASLARLAGSSRSRFAARFSAVLGVPPAAYLLELRMAAAARALAGGEARISELAQRSGYASAAAFSRAFKRVRGKAPRAERRGER